MFQLSPKYAKSNGGNLDMLSQVSESKSICGESETQKENNEVETELMTQIKQEGAEFNPNEMFPTEFKHLLTVPENTHKNKNSFTPMSFNRAGAGNNFLGISPHTYKEVNDENTGAFSKKSGAVFSTSYPWANS